MQSAEIAEAGDEVHEDLLHDEVVARRGTRTTLSRSREGIWEPDPTPPGPSLKVKSLGSGQKRQSLSTTKPLSSVRKPKEVARVPTATALVSSNSANDTSESGNVVLPLQNTESPALGILFPNQVFALFKGTPRNYYPGSCVGVNGETGRMIIRWEGEEYPDSEIDVYGVKRLELRPGDVVRVNLQDFESTGYVVRGFKNAIERPSRSTVPTTSMTDIYGQTTLLLESKEPKNAADRGVKTAPIGSVYLTGKIWAQMKDRDFKYVPPPRQAGFQTPSERPSTPSANPPSRSRRETLHSLGSKLALTPATVGLFSGMVFAISCEDEDKRNALSLQLEKHGGRVLGEGFADLFQGTSSSNVTPRKQAKFTPDRSTSTSGFALAQEAGQIGFAAVLAETFSRKPKYMQALALGIPCLHFRWVQDCLSKDTIRPWTSYLLPAGKSDYLDSAIRSRVLPSTDAQTVKLSDTIASRPNLLQGESVLVALGRGKNETRQKACAFLLSAMGAGQVSRANDLKAAKALMGQGWDWIVTDNAIRTSKVFCRRNRRSGPLWFKVITSSSR